MVKPTKNFQFQRIALQGRGSRCEVELRNVLPGKNIFLQRILHQIVSENLYNYAYLCEKKSEVSS